MRESQITVSKVVSENYCVGCGSCAFALRGKMRLDPTGRLLPVLPAGHDAGLFERVCPFSGSSVNEDVIASERFENLPYSGLIGRNLSCYVGYAVTDDFRGQGSSGGLTTWVACKLLEHGLIDRVLHVKGAQEPGLLFEYAISTSVAEVRGGAKSRYYPVTMDEVLRQISSSSHRYLLIGLPCFVKAIRLLQREYKALKEQIPFCAAIFCGHLKTTRYAEDLAAQAGVQTLTSIDFRRKTIDRPANDYDTEFFVDRKAENAESVIRRTSSLEGTDWGLGFFKNPACDYCDDIVGETADVSFGDAWLPRTVLDPRGTNVIVTRNARIDELLREAATSGDLVLESITVAEAAASQEANFRHRRDGLSYRLWRKEIEGRWYPKKRVKPRFWHLSQTRRRIYRLREVIVELTTLSHANGARERNERLAKILCEYRELYRRETRPTLRQRLGMMVCQIRVKLGRIRLSLLRKVSRHS